MQLLVEPRARVRLGQVARQVQPPREDRLDDRLDLLHRHVEILRQMFARVIVQVGEYFTNERVKTGKKREKWQKRWRSERSVETLES